MENASLIYKLFMQLKIEYRIVKGIQRQALPESVREIVLREARESGWMPKKAQRRQEGCAVPRSFYVQTVNENTRRSFYPHINRMLDELFRDFETAVSRDCIATAYVKLDHNTLIADELLRQFNIYAHRIQQMAHGSPVKLQLFTITGNAGVGKSAFLQYVQSGCDGRHLQSSAGETSEQRLVISVNCIAPIMRSPGDVLRGVLTALADECVRRTSLWSAVTSVGLDKPIMRSEGMEDTSARQYIVSTLELLQGYSGCHSNLRVPVCLILDNLDRAMGGLDAKRSISEFALGLSNRGCALVVLPLRHGTKRLIDMANDDCAVIATHEIAPPECSAVMAARFNAAFSNDVLNHPLTWYE